MSAIRSYRRKGATIAKSQGLSPSDYVRAAVMFLAVMDGDVEALKITAESVRAKFATLVRPRYEVA